MLIAMLEHPTFAATDLSSVKAICSGDSTAIGRRIDRSIQLIRIRYEPWARKGEAPPETMIEIRYIRPSGM
jgi:hypothetical protein